MHKRMMMTVPGTPDLPFPSLRRKDAQKSISAKSNEDGTVTMPGACQICQTGQLLAASLAFGKALVQLKANRHQRRIKKVEQNQCYS